MALTPDELERMAEESEGLGVSLIRQTVHCGHCGYNLKSLPVVHQCPECGHSYSAHPGRMRGIYKPGDESFPTGRIATALLCAVIACALLGGGLLFKEPISLTFAFLFFGVTAILVYKVVADIQTYSRDRMIRARITEERHHGQPR